MAHDEPTHEVAEAIVESTLVNQDDSNAVLTAEPPVPLSPPNAAWSEVFMWRVYYPGVDGGADDVYPEVDEMGNDRGFATVDLARVKAIELAPMRQGISGGVVKIDQSSGMRPIFFRRRFIMTTMEGIEVQRATAHCLGWQKTLEVGDEKRNVAVYNFFFEDGSVLITDDANAI